jgi:hypothetical protein
MLMYSIERLFRKKRTEQQLDSELRFHLEQRSRELASAGMTLEEVRRRARLEFGGVEGIKEQCHESCYIPARRAASVNPVAALRCD